jgi:pyruvate/2-oxoglutarate/acetoin dehydrogenase E1 component
VYPKNTASPRALRAKVTKRTDGTPITSGVVAFHHAGTTRSAVAGDAAVHVGNGTWSYTPTQAETNYDEFGIEFYHEDAVAEGPQVTVVTSDVRAEVDAALEADPTLNKLDSQIEETPE